MDKHAAAVEGLHYSRERLEIRCGGRLEIYGDVNIRHSQSCYHAALVRNCVIGYGQREIDHRVETGLTDHSKLFLGRLTGCTKFVINQAEVIDFRQGI